MKKIFSFKEYMLLKEGSRTTSSKSGLYPASYGGIQLYPPADWLTHAADAIYYLSIYDRLYNNQDKSPFGIEHLPGHKLYGDKINNGDKGPFNIEHLPK